MISLWKDILPNGIHIVAGNADVYTKPLTNLELQSLGIADTQRTREFQIGRSYAHQALSLLDANQENLLRCSDTGGVIWPKSVLGSITHTHHHVDSHYAVAVGRSTQFKLLGVDAELQLDLHPSLWQEFILPQEFDWLAKVPMDQRIQSVKEIWCLKEAAIKANGHGNMLDFIVLKQPGHDKNNEFMVTFSHFNQQIELIGHALSPYGLTLAIVYQLLIDCTSGFKQDACFPEI